MNEGQGKWWCSKRCPVETNAMKRMGQSELGSLRGIRESGEGKGEDERGRNKEDGKDWQLCR